MQLIHNEQADVLHVLPLLPPPGEHVPLLRGADHDVALGQELQVGGCLSSQADHSLAQVLPELSQPVSIDLQKKISVFHFHLLSDSHHRQHR